MNSIIEQSSIAMAKKDMEIGRPKGNLEHAQRSIARIIKDVKDPFIEGQLEMLLTQLEY